MASSPIPPFDLDAEPLVTGSVEISNDRLIQGFSWLVATVKEQNRVMDALSSQIDSLKVGAVEPAHSGDGRRASMKEEMLVMQINAVKHEVGSLPRSSDLERQRERTMAEVHNISNTLSDRNRESSERLQKELADVTDSLCNQLKRIGDDVFSRLEILEQRPQAPAPAAAPAAPAQAPSAAAAAVSQPPASQPQVQGSIPPPLPNPMSSSSIAAEDTEDHTDGLLMSERPAAAFTGGGSQVDMALMDAITARLDGLERQVQDLRTEVRQPAAADAGPTPAARETSEPPLVNQSSSAGNPPDSHAGAVSADPSVAFMTAPPDLAAPAVPPEPAAVPPQGDPKHVDPIQDVSAIISAAVAAATDAATTVATQAVAEAAQGERGDVASLQEEMLNVRRKLESLAQSVSEVPSEPKSQEVQVQETPVREVQPTQANPETQSESAAQSTALASLQERLTSVEAAVKQVEGVVPQVRTVPILEASIQTVQQSLEVLRQQTQQLSQPPPQPQPASDAKAVTVTEKEAARSELPEPAPEDARHKDMLAVSDEELERLMARLQDMEELQEKAEKRIQQVEGRLREVRSRSGSISLDRKAPASRNTTLTASKTSEPSADGSVGGSWKDVQAELERFRKLFEFIEGVLPQDAAEAMRFFNRREAGKEEMSGMISEIFGADIEFQNAKSQLESEFKMHTRELRREFDKLTLALKGLQRDVDTSGSKVVDLSRRTSQLETEVRLSPAVAISSMEDPHQEPSPRGPVEGRRDSKDMRDKALQGMSQEMQRAIQELRDEIRQWIELFKSSVVQALQSKPDHEQVADFVKQVVGASAGEKVALFAKRQLLGKCASCSAPIDVDLLRVKRPQPIGLQEHWPPGENLGAKVAIRPLNAGGVSPNRLPKIDARRDNPKARGMKSSASTPELRKDQDNGHARKLLASLSHRLMLHNTCQARLCETPLSGCFADGSYKSRSGIWIMTSSFSKVSGIIDDDEEDRQEISQRAQALYQRAQDAYTSKGSQKDVLRLFEDAEAAMRPLLGGGLASLNAQASFCFFATYERYLTLYFEADGFLAVEIGFMPLGRIRHRGTSVVTCFLPEEDRSAPGSHDGSDSPLECLG
ncbi:mfsd6b [Symbiodinium sp. CCMP2592]|nr:mfsd6b [Symbiodinium sp. CCMP2592]